MGRSRRRRGEVNGLALFLSWSEHSLSLAPQFSALTRQFPDIEFIAVDEGYTLVVDSSDLNIIWYSTEIDITDLVIQRLRALAR